MSEETKTPQTLTKRKRVKYEAIYDSLTTLILSGATLKQIANALKISVKTAYRFRKRWYDENNIKEEEREEIKKQAIAEALNYYKQIIGRAYRELVKPETSETGKARFMNVIIKALEEKTKLLARFGVIPPEKQALEIANLTIQDVEREIKKLLDEKDEGVPE